MLDLAIVIVNYRSWSKLEDCLSSLDQQTEKIKKVIVVDNRSDDGILENFIKKFPWVVWIKNDTNAGFAAACNLGTQKTSSQWLLFLNPDTRLPKDCLKTLIPYCDQHPEFHLISIKQISESGKNTHPYGIFPNVLNSAGLLRSLERLILHPDQTKKAMAKNPIAFPQWISGSFVLVRKEHFDLIGGWDDRFWMYCEDIDLSKRAAEANLKRVILNEWKCLHFHGVSSRGSLKTKIKTKAAVTKSTHIYFEKHFSGINKKWAHQWLKFHKTVELYLLSFFDASKRETLKILIQFWRELFSE
jgi:GT2 family glycosyltransferase